MEPVVTIVVLGAKSTSITLSITDIGLIISPISAGIACALSLGIRVSHKMIKNKYKKYKKQYEKGQQRIKSFDEFYRKSSLKSLIDKVNMILYVKF